MQQSTVASPVPNTPVAVVVGPAAASVVWSLGAVWAWSLDADAAPIAVLGNTLETSVGKIPTALATSIVIRPENDVPQVLSARDDYSAVLCAAEIAPSGLPRGSVVLAIVPPVFPELAKAAANARLMRRGVRTVILVHPGGRPTGVPAMKLADMNRLLGNRLAGEWPDVTWWSPPDNAESALGQLPIDSRLRSLVESVFGISLPTRLPESSGRKKRWPVAASEPSPTIKVRSSNKQESS